MVYEQQLQAAGLTRDEAALYEVLIQHASLPTSKAAKRSNISRTLAYKVLDDLEKKGLVEKKEERGKVTVFQATHPMKLKEVADNEYKKSQAAISAVDEIFERMVSDFNLVSGKPGVRYFEGIEGIQAVLNDSLRAHETIYSFADLESIEKYIPAINKKYVEEREKRGLRKRGIVLDTPFARTFLQDYIPGLTETRVIPVTSIPFQTVMQMYDRTISYITLTDEHTIGVIVEDPHITTMHRHLFEHIWATASEPLTTSTPSTPPQV